MIPSSVIDPVYLPFTPDELREHFLVNKDKQVEIYQKSARAYRDFLNDNADRKGIPITQAKGPCQIERDERFWTATTLKRLVDSPNRTDLLTKLLTQTYGISPPLKNFDDWADCLEGPLQLVLEAALPSSKTYMRWLRDSGIANHPIPFIRHAADRTTQRVLEGPTRVDGLIVNTENGFALMVEAKVLSDISYSVSFDASRNQIARYIDVMLEPGRSIKPLLGKRKPESTLFLLLTPQYFRDRPQTRLYGYVFGEYKADPLTILRDLPHRHDIDLKDDNTYWINLSRRLGWVTFEDVKALLPDACPWLQA